MIAENPQPDRPIGTASDRDLGGPTAPGEKVEAESDAFISRRDKQRPKTEGERDEEALWRASERRAEATRREANRREWVAPPGPSGPAEGQPRLADIPPRGRGPKTLRR